MTHETATAGYQNHTQGRAGVRHYETATSSPKFDDGSPAAKSWRDWNAKQAGQKGRGGKGRLNQTESAQVAAQIDELLNQYARAAAEIGVLINQQKSNR